MRLALQRVRGYDGGVKAWWEGWLSPHIPSYKLETESTPGIKSFWTSKVAPVTHL